MEATLNGALIHYERAGAGLPAIFLHAGIADSRMWAPQMRTIGKHFECIAPDLRGFGKSELPPQHWSPIADLLSLVDHLKLKPVHLVGCSIGGGIAIDFALEHAERISKLVLVGPGVGGTNFRAKYPDLIAEMEEAEKSGDQRAIIDADARFWLDGPRRPEGYVKDPIRRLFFEMDSNFDSDFERAPIDQIDPPAAQRLHDITAPTLVVIGDEDMPPVFDAVELLMENLPHARTVVIHDAAHLPNLEHPDEFNREVLAFLLED